MPARSGRRHTLVIKSGSNRGRKIHLGGGKRVYGALRKTTKKGAYNKARKANFQKRRAPFVETKQQTDQMVATKAGILTGTPNDTIRMTTEQLQIPYGTISGSGVVAPQTLTLFPINSFLNMNPGIGATELIGQSCYSRYLKCKVEFELPFHQNQIKHPCDMFLIHGWVTTPINANLHTTPTMVDITRDNVQDHIQEQVLEYFNQRTDKLQYIPKRTSNIKILGYRKLKVKNNSNLGPDPTWVSQGANPVYGWGARPVINMVCNWRTKRKIHYVEGDTNLPAGPAGIPLAHMYPNYAWLPFMALYNPTAAEFLSSVRYPGGTPGSNDPPEMFIRYNSIHYFSDS